MTALILFVAASSLYALVLGYSRIPYAAARDGQFFEVFGRLHPTKRFPHVSLLTIGAVTIPFCFFTLGQLVNWLLLVQILLQFIWQCAGVILLRRTEATSRSRSGCGSIRCRRSSRWRCGSISSRGADGGVLAGVLFAVAT